MSYFCRFSLSSVPGVTFKSGILKSADIALLQQGLFLFLFSSRPQMVHHFKELSTVVLADNDSEDEGPSTTQVRKKVEELTEVKGEQKEVGDGEADFDEEDVQEDDGEVSPQVEGLDLSSDGEGRQTPSASMSTRSESKPYSSVTHKCEVRDTDRDNFAFVLAFCETLCCFSLGTNVVGLHCLSLA